LQTDETLKAELAKDFVLVHLNYSKENKNPQAMAQLGYPQRFGFPVWVILDGKGNRLHTQESGALETPGEKGHDPEKVLAVLKGWSPQALDPAQYSE
ncbi:MAG: thioredoxin family protein, partial [Acidobacteria bacterium]|nr:thioredoxin family protein [Acidobacteriota bacterium]